MRIAIFSDIHGNAFALEAVCTAIKHDGEFDHIVAAGDLAFGGSDPAKCVDLLREHHVMAVYGNTEEYIYAPHKPPGDELHLRKWDRLLADVWWVREQLGSKRIRWLETLPFDLRFKPTADPAEDLLVFHANPISVEEMIYPPIEDQRTLMGEIIQANDDETMIRLISGVSARTMAFGHYHFTSERYWREYRLVNVAPVSMPAKDFDPRARYTIFSWERDRWNVIRRYIDYDYTQEIEALKQSGMPHFRDHINTFPKD